MPWACGPRRARDPVPFPAHVGHGTRSLRPDFPLKSPRARADSSSDAPGIPGRGQWEREMRTALRTLPAELPRLAAAGAAAFAVTFAACTAVLLAVFGG